MELNQYSSIFWDFGGVITSSPFEAFNKFEIENDLPENFLRKVNSTNPQNNAWALLEQSKINQMEFNELFFNIWLRENSKNPQFTKKLLGK